MKTFLAIIGLVAFMPALFILSYTVGTVIWILLPIILFGVLLVQITKKPKKSKKKGGKD